MFVAEKGNGSYLNNSRIRVSKKKIKDSSYLLQEDQSKQVKKNEIFSEYIRISSKVTNIRKFGSAALDMALVASGKCDGYWQRELNYWDVAAGIVIVKEAGGFVDFFENDNNLPLKKNVLATNSLIHKELKVLLEKKDIE